MNYYNHIVNLFNICSLQLWTSFFFLSSQTTFEVPEGNDTLVLDLQGMGKGYAWVNGQSIGRYWPSFIADDKGCEPCDYRHEYDSNKCRTDCGKPSQRW